jgi:hypothetical protein
MDISVTTAGTDNRINNIFKRKRKGGETKMGLFMDKKFFTDKKSISESAHKYLSMNCMQACDFDPTTLLSSIYSAVRTIQQENPHRLNKRIQMPVTIWIEKQNGDVSMPSCARSLYCAKYYYYPKDSRRMTRPKKIKTFFTIEDCMETERKLFPELPFTYNCLICHIRCLFKLSMGELKCKLVPNKNGLDNQLPCVCKDAILDELAFVATMEKQKESNHTSQ